MRAGPGAGRHHRVCRLAVDGSEDQAYRRDVLSSLACPSLHTLDGYTDLLEHHGFVDIQAEDVSPDYEKHYQKAMARLEDANDWITARFGAKVLAIVTEKNGFALKAFEKRQIGGGQFLARLPG